VLVADKVLEYMGRVQWAYLEENRRALHGVAYLGVVIIRTVSLVGIQANSSCGLAAAAGASQYMHMRSNKLNWDMSAEFEGTVVNIFLGMIVSELMLLSLYLISRLLEMLYLIVV
jgi:hypothetical protein